MSAARADRQAQRSGKSGRPARAIGVSVCPACGEENKVSARFCQACGRSVAAGDGGRFNAQTLTVIGAGLVTLLALGALFSTVIDTSTNTGGNSAVTAPARTASTPAGQPPDLSTMTPREAADRLFNRVMMADEQGLADEVAQFAPMAVAAYDRLESLDTDALYHLGMIHAAAGDVDRARDATERLKAIVPKHLLVSVIEHRLATDTNDQDKAERAIDQFKANYAEEINVDRFEYDHHRRVIDLFREQIGMNAGGS